MIAPVPESVLRVYVHRLVTGARLVRTESLICIVDDDQEVRESICTFFRSAGIKVVKFAAAEDLLAFSELAIMDILITDLHMPGMDGLALQRELRRQGNQVPVILMTAFPTAEAKREAALLGIAAFIAKPTDPELLLEQVEALLAA
jgi:FixJ family two-component response regulator